MLVHEKKRTYVMGRHIILSFKMVPHCDLHKDLNVDKKENLDITIEVLTDFDISIQHSLKKMICDKFLFSF